ncbi:dehydrin Xero 2-like [Malania oleifera]|uniref:dehydrin Xero 2-like n=1 Tax=Malania oleifera TaxID=397392 RepID=UPI0025AE4D07|nr:dehydrin Xero 2-like [Malania oleifera]
MAHMRDEYDNIRQTDGDQMQHHKTGGYDTAAGTGKQGGMAMSGQHQTHDGAYMTGGQHGTIPGGTDMHDGRGQTMPQQEMGDYNTAAGTGTLGSLAMSGQHQTHDGAYRTGGQHGTIPGGTVMHGGSGQMMPRQEHDASRGMLHRSGSSSSSDSEDDGEGGRRKKKGLKERLPGHRHSDQTHKSATTIPGGPGAYDATQHEKKGIMEKIKEKLPGDRHEDQTHRSETTTPGGLGAYDTTAEHQHEKKGITLKERLPGHRHDDQTHKSAPTTPRGPEAYDATADQQHEKKGIMDKIKEKLPGHH